MTTSRIATIAQVAQLKGTVLAGYIAWIRDHGLLEEVRKRVPPETAALLDDPPLAISWVDTVHSRNVLDALEAVRGLDEVRRMGAETLAKGVLRIVRPMTAGLARVTGASPAAIFARLETVLRVVVRGYDVRFVEKGSTGGLLEMRIHGLEDSRAGLVAGWENAFEAVLATAGVRGTVRLQHFAVEGADTVATFLVKWEPRRGSLAPT